MEVTTAYATALAVTLFVAVLFRTIAPRFSRQTPAHFLARISTKICPPLFVCVVRLRRYTLFSSGRTLIKFLRRNGFIQPWKLQDLGTFLLYLGVNIFCVFIAFPGLTRAGIRAGRLAIINLLLLYAGPHLSFLSDILNVRLSAFRRIHVTTGLTTFVLALFHIVTQSKNVTVVRCLVALANLQWVSLSLSFQSVLSILARRFLWYELGLRLHQLNAILLIYSLLRHITTDQMVYVYIGTGIFSATSAVQLLLVLYRNRLGTSLTRISLDKDTIRLRLRLRQPLRVEAGQYVNIWMPFISTWSAWQSHPFTVVSWSELPQSCLEIIIDPARGWTERLLEVARLGETTTISMFSGPHGAALSFDGYESILVLAQGFKIFSCFPHLRKIMHECAVRKSAITRVHLVYETQVFSNGEEIDAFVNDEFLKTSENFSVTHYATEADTKGEFKELGGSGRAVVFGGAMPLGSVLQTEVQQRRPEYRSLVLTALSPGYEDKLNTLINKRLNDRLDVVDSVR